jgi:hypothetical protein
LASVGAILIALSGASFEQAAFSCSSFFVFAPGFLFILIALDLSFPFSDLYLDSQPHILMNCCQFVPGKLMIDSWGIS